MGVEVRDGVVTVDATLGDCVIDPVDTTLHGDAPAGSRRITVACADGIVAGGRYLMTKPNREREWIHVVGVRGRDLQLKQPIIHRYAGAATIVGARISIAVAPAWTARASNLSDDPRIRHGLARYVLRWTYAIDGHAMVGISYADLVAMRASDLVTPADIDARWPGWSARQPPEHQANQGADFITEAVRAIRVEAIGDSYAQRRLRDADVLRELVNARARVIRLEHEVMHGRPFSAELEIAERHYRASYMRLVDLPERAEPPLYPTTRRPVRRRT